MWREWVKQVVKRNEKDYVEWRVRILEAEELVQDTQKWNKWEC